MPLMKIVLLGLLIVGITAIGSAVVNLAPVYADWVDDEP